MHDSYFVSEIGRCWQHWAEAWGAQQPRHGQASAETRNTDWHWALHRDGDEGGVTAEKMNCPDTDFSL